MGNFNLRQWYKGGVAAGVALIVAAAAAGNSALMLFGVGTFVLSWGEWINHPFQSRLAYDDAGRHIGTFSGEPRRNKIVGLILAGIGGLVFLGGLAILVIAAVKQAYA